jgi:hypothetical protein
MRKALWSVSMSSFVVCLLATGSAQAAPAWPSLRDQLVAGNVFPGSPLERLIRDNQDFSLLRPDEASDHLGLPPWLRVYWRKNHPELAYGAADPTGGYPRALHEMYEWMITHQNLEPAAAEPPRLLTRVPSKSGEQRISGLQSVPRSEADIRVNYWSPSLVVAASNNIQASGHQGMYYSTNGGVSWGQTTLPFVTGDSSHSDPTVDWTSDGTAWSTTIGISGANLRMRAYKSTNNGASWSFDATFSGTQTATDKELIWVDHGNSSPYKNNLYAIWHNGAPVYVNRRTGPGGSWGSPLKISGSQTTGTGIGADIKTNSAGHVFAFWPDTGSRGLYVAKSTNGGSSYATPVRLATTYDSYDIGVPAFNSRRALIYVTAGAFKNPAKDNVYAVWTDLTGASGCNSASNEPGSNTASACKTRIWFARSTNGGTSWESAKMINNQSSKSDQFNPWLVVDETTGALAVIYYDTVDDAGRKKTHVYQQSSYDDGIAWNAPFRVTTAQTDETVSGADANNQYGDYNGHSGYNALFFPAWTDRRNNAREEIWTAALSEPVPPGNPFTYVNAADQRAACKGIASHTSSWCDSISDFNDRQMCYGLAQSSQTPCTTMTDRNLQLACYGISVKPNYPSNCRDITDVNMKHLCYGAAGVAFDDIGQCTPISWRNTQLLCFALNDFVSSNCYDITVANDRNFCYGVSSHTTTYCDSIQ